MTPKKPPRRTVYDMIHESVPRRTRGGRDRKLAAIAKRLKVRVKEKTNASR